MPDLDEITNEIAKEPLVFTVKDEGFGFFRGFYVYDFNHYPAVAMLLPNKIADEYEKAVALAWLSVLERRLGYTPTCAEAAKRACIDIRLDGGHFFWDNKELMTARIVHTDGSFTVVIKDV